MFGYICLSNIFLSEADLWMCVEMFIVARVIPMSYMIPYLGKERTGENREIPVTTRWMFEDIHLAVISTSPIFPIFPSTLVPFSLFPNPAQVKGLCFIINEISYFWQWVLWEIPAGSWYIHSEPWPRILGLILVKGWSFDYALFGEDLTMVLVKSWSYFSQRLVTLVTLTSLWLTFD